MRCRESFSDANEDMGSTADLCECWPVCHVSSCFISPASILKVIVLFQQNRQLQGQLLLFFMNLLSRCSLSMKIWAIHLHLLEKKVSYYRDERGFSDDPVWGQGQCCTGGHDLGMTQSLLLPPAVLNRGFPKPLNSRYKLYACGCFKPWEPPNWTETNDLRNACIINSVK